MGCPFLLIDSGRKICRRMIEQGLDGELDDFDITHYCKSNLNHCFFFRSFNNRTEIMGSPEENELNVHVVPAPTVPISSIVLKEPTQPNERSSKRSDKLLKLKRIFHRIT